ncbi:MAG: DUF1080 domain-containing protein [Planctomycetaceae bacterium]|nr:DUF1080 domain-containing protein [Planctomycetaceae bacterium]
MKNFLFMLLLTLSPALLFAQDNAVPAETRLFDNVTLDSFDFYLDENGKKDSVFSIEDGVLKVNVSKPFGWICTKREYKNFSLSVEYRWSEKVEPVNSGIFLRISGEPKMFLPHGFEVQLQHNNAGDIYGFHGKKISGEKERYIENLNHKAGELRGVKRIQGAESLPGEWNKVNITCFEGLIVVRMNGKIVNWAFGAETAAGKIGFQSEGGQVEFRNAVIVEEPGNIDSAK